MMWPVRRRILMLGVSGLVLLATVGESAVGVRARTEKTAPQTSSAPVQRPARDPSGGSGGSGLGGGTNARPTGPDSPPGAVSLDTGWSYAPDPGNVGVGQGWWQGRSQRSPVSIPNDFNPNVTAGSDRGTIGWYEIKFQGPPVFGGRGWAVHFEGVRRHAQVWLNGELLGSSTDPYAPFSLTAGSLEPGRTNVLVVRVDNFRGGGSFPEDWWNWGGITGPVTLQPVGRLALQDLGVLPQLGCSYHCGHLLVEGTLANHAPAKLHPQVVVDVIAPDGGRVHWRGDLTPVASGKSQAISFNVPVHGQPVLWSPDHPSLYTVQVAVTVGHRTEQSQVVHVGMRAIHVHGGILYLNGQRIWLHGAAIHEDIQGTGAALSDGDINTIVSELRSVGANVTRAHYLLNPRLLDALDAAGIMVWEQPPVDHADGHLRKPAGRSRALSMLSSTILGDRNHASVIFNSVANELSPTPDTTPGTNTYLSQAIGLARRLDPAAAVALDTYCYPGFKAQKLYTKLDVLGIDSYFGWYKGLRGHSTANFSELEPFLQQAHQRYPKQALAVSEFGAEGLYSGSPSTKGTYEFQSDYLKRTYDVVGQLPFMNGAIYWTLREFAVQPGWTGGAVLPPGSAPDGIHHKGLIGYDGTPKPAYSLAQSLFPQQPRFVR